MNRWLLAIVILVGTTLVGCSNNGTNGKGMAREKPPIAFIKIGNETYDTKLGLYCWKGETESTCVDTAGPVELLKNVKPIQVHPGTEVVFEMNYDPKPNEFHVLQINGDKETDVVVEDNHFTTPMEKGVYYYSYGVWWMDKKEVNLSNGDAFYSFVLEVN